MFPKGNDFFNFSLNLNFANLLVFAINKAFHAIHTRIQNLPENLKNVDQFVVCLIKLLLLKSQKSFCKNLMLSKGLLLYSQSVHVLVNAKLK